MDTHTHICMGVLQANSEKGHVQKCPESWARFSPFKVPGLNVLLFPYCKFTKSCYWFILYLQYRCYVIFICYLLSFCSDQYYFHFLGTQLLPGVSSNSGIWFLAQWAGCSCSGYTTSQGLEGQMTIHTEHICVLGCSHTDMVDFGEAKLWNREGSGRCGFI